VTDSYIFVTKMRTIKHSCVVYIMTAPSILPSQLWTVSESLKILRFSPSV